MRCRNGIEKRLGEGTFIVLDRYAESGVAYSAAKGLDMNWCKAPDHGLPAPDLTIFIDVPSEGSANRNGYGEERYERQEFQKKVRQIFEQMKSDCWIVQLKSMILSPFTSAEFRSSMARGPLRRSRSELWSLLVKKLKRLVNILRPYRT